MKFAIIVASGLTDRPQETLGGATPLEAARTPHLNAIAQTGRVGLVRTVPEAPGMDAGAGLLSILGYDARRHYHGRGGIEALGAGLEVHPEEWGLRCDFVTFGNDTFVDFSAGHISTAEAAELLDALTSELDCPQVRFAAGLGHRGAMVARPEGAFDVTCRAPMETMGRTPGACLPEGEGSGLLRRVFEVSREVFDGHDVNRVRLDLDERPASAVWPWGPGPAVSLASFESRYGLRGVAVSALRYVHGLAKAIGWGCPVVEGTDGCFDTDYAAKTASAIDALREVDIAMVHVDSIADASMQGDVALKLRCIEDLDAMVVGPLREWTDGGDRRLLILPDCSQWLAPQQQVHEPVPFLMSRQRVASARPRPFTEKGAADSGLVVEDGHQLMQYFLRG